MIKNKRLRNKIAYMMTAAVIAGGTAVNPIQVMATAPEQSLEETQESLLEEETEAVESELIEADELSEEIPDEALSDALISEPEEYLDESEGDEEEYGIVFDNLDAVPHVPNSVIRARSEGLTGADGETTVTSPKYIPVGNRFDPETDSFINYNTTAKQQSISANSVGSTRYYVNETCWAFASMGALEASYNKNNGIYSTNGKPLTTAQGALDLSERQLVYFTYFNDNRTAADPMRTLENDNNYLYIGGTTLDTAKMATLEEAFALGGSPAYSMETLAMGIGPVSEAAVPYSTEASPDNNLKPVDGANKFRSQYEMTSGRTIDMAQRNLVKSMILEYGSVSTGIYYDTKYLNIDTKKETISDNSVSGNKVTKTTRTVYYHHPSQASNHQVLVVGWDDDIDVSKFKTSSHAEGSEEKGGWLCKNSYGNSVTSPHNTNAAWSYDDGYFWVSYDTTDALLSGSSVRRGYTFNLNKLESENVTDNRTYQYDGSAFSKEIKAGSRFANIFSVKPTGEGETEYLRSVMVKLATPGSVYSVQVYADPDDSNPMTGTPLLTKPVYGTVDAAGYYEVKLGQGIPVSAETKLAVVVSLFKAKIADETPGIYSAVSGKYTMSVAKNRIIKSDDDSKTVPAMFYCLNTTKVGHSFIYNTKNNAWEDMFNNADSSNIKGNVRIKLKTVVKSTPEERIDPDYTVVDHYEKKVKPTGTIQEPLVFIDSASEESGSTLVYVGQSAKIQLPVAEGISWVSKKEKIAVIDPSGKVTGVKKGTAQVEGTVGGVTYRHKIIVRNPSFVCKRMTVPLTVSGQLEINGAYQKVVWSSAKPDIVEVNPATGSYKAKKAGAAAIKATLGSTTVTCKIKVPKPAFTVKSVTLAPEADSYVLKLSDKRINKDEVTYISSDPAVVKVDAHTGELKAAGNGKAFVTANVLGSSAKCNVIVEGY